MRVAGHADGRAVGAMLGRAFADDPALRWIIPDPAERARRLPRLFRLMFDSDAATGMRLVTAGGEAVALWRAPGAERTGTLATVRRAWPLWRALGPALGRAMAVGEAIEAHFPAGQFWYLHLAGCDPARQGRGFGAAAVRSGLARAARRLPAYLETANERNLGFYRALGFEVTGEWTVPRGGPRFWSMLRAAG